jgi:DNA-binding NarL/FixJ family response regulator
MGYVLTPEKNHKYKLNMASFRTMIIDNDIKTVKFISKFIKNGHSFELLSIEQNSCEAINKISGIKPDLLFIGIEMPHICAFELINIFRSRGIEPRIVLLAPNDIYASKAIKAGVFDYLVKPVKPEDLQDCMNRLVRLEHLRYIQFSVNEHRIINEIKQGNNTENISNNLNIAASTVRYHKNKMFRKAGVKNTAEFLYQITNTPDIVLR